MKRLKALLMCCLLTIVSVSYATTNGDEGDEVSTSNHYMDFPYNGIQYRIYFHYSSETPYNIEPTDSPEVIWDSVTVVGVNDYGLETDNGERTILSEYTSEHYDAYRPCIGCGPLLTYHSAPVVGIERGAFSEEFNDYYDSSYGVGARGYTITKVNMPNSIRWIKGGGFSYSSIQEITIPENVTFIEYNAFYGCENLRVVNWNATHAEIIGSPFVSSYYFFSPESPIESFIFGDNVEYIPSYLCYGTKIESVTIPEQVTSIEKRTFRSCQNLTNVTMSNNVQTIGESAFEGCYSLKSINLPDSLHTIGNYAFEYCDLSSFIVPDNVEYIGSKCVSFNPNLKEVYIPSTATLLFSEYKDDVHERESPIYYCTSIEKITAPAFCFDILESAYTENAKSIQEITVNSGELTSNAWGFINRSKKTLQKLNIAATSNTLMEDEALDGCYKLTSLALPASCEHIGYKAMAECVMLKDIVIPASVTEIDDRAFEDCRSIETITFGENKPNAIKGHYNGVSAQTTNLRRIGNWAFYNAHELQNLVIPEGVEEIGDAAFYGCVYLEEMVLPSTVTQIGDNTFALCSKMRKITVNATAPPQIHAKTFYDVKRQIPVYVPDECVEMYENDPLWSEFDIQGVFHMPTAIDNMQHTNRSYSTKILSEDQVLIRRGDKVYTLQGQILK